MMMTWLPWVLLVLTYSAGCILSKGLLGASKLLLAQDPTAPVVVPKDKTSLFLILFLWPVFPLILLLSRALEDEKGARR
jgi:hypothetical protein